MTPLQVTLIQSHLLWENPEGNRHLFSEKIKSITEPTDVIILPEMFTTGFSMNAPTYAEPTHGITLEWMQEMAALTQAAIIGSIMVTENEKFYNRLLWVEANKDVVYYDKRHTFTLAGEHLVYEAGSKLTIIDYKGWKICPLICYDLRFPVWSRNTHNYDLLLYVANWPQKRIEAWDALLKARAIENMSYCIGVNRTGLDGNGHNYTGHSACYDMLGKQCSQANFETEFIETLLLDKERLVQTREKLQFLNDQDQFTIH